MLFCPTHPQTRLLYALKGGAGFCIQCRLYVQAAGVPEPKPTKTTGKPQTVGKKARGKNGSKRQRNRS
jgi:hypothetical protein